MKQINRQIILDTETTGMNKSGIYYIGHSIIEIGAIEIINRHITGKKFHVYINPNRLIDKDAFKIHGISNQFLLNKPNFFQISKKLINFISDSELIIHNASFDVNFINYEFSKFNKNNFNIKQICTITDSLLLARKLFPGKNNSLDSLCKRFLINQTNRIFHGALLDAELLAKVFLLMTSKQKSINFNLNLSKKINIINKNVNTKEKKQQLIPIIYANKNDLIAHNQILNLLNLKSNKNCIWKK